MDETLNRFLDSLEERGEMAYSPDTFDGRLRIQKTVYLLQAMGEQVGRRFGFNVYYRGPYSPSLARVYYGKTSATSSSSEPEQVPSELLDDLAAAADRGNDFLEAAATLHAYSKRPNYGRDESLHLVKNMKPHIAPGTVEEAWEFLTDHGMVEPEE